MKKLILFFTALSISPLSWSAPGSYETQLMKLSKALKGEPASWQDRQELAKAQADGQVDAFLLQKAQTYLNDAKFTLKLKQKVDEMVRLIPQSAEQTNNGYEVGKRLTAYDRLIQKVIAENRPWDDLLKEKNYTAYTNNSFFNNDELEFYNLLTKNEQSNRSIGDLLDVTKDTRQQEFNFDPQDQRLAGMVTTPRFFERFVTTALNKNRRRAAAVFRIFLCDTMIPTVPKPDSSTIQKDYDVILPDHKNVTEEQLRKNFAGNIHGEQSDCMSCHYKLDPLGQVFAFSAGTLSPKASPGALRYKGKDDRQVDIPLRGFGDMAEVITQQSEYAHCQVSNFWRWYIGKDVPLTAEREQQLVDVFNQVQRKPKDFVAYLVQQPEFKEKPRIMTEEQLLAQRATKVLKNCTSCHESTGEAVWDLTKLPYSGDEARRTKKINLIAEVIDIAGGGKNASMPPKESLWQLSPDDFNTLSKWIEKGAPDLQGTPQIPTRGTP